MGKWLMALVAGCGSSVNFGYPPDFPDAGDAGSSSSPLTAPAAVSNCLAIDGGTCR